jgi:hypothetical protein
MTSMINLRKLSYIKLSDIVTFSLDMTELIIHILRKVLETEYLAIPRLLLLETKNT